jgi:hypothetical protein
MPRGKSSGRTWEQCQDHKDNPHGHGLYAQLVSDPPAHAGDPPVRTAVEANAPKGSKELFHGFILCTDTALRLGTKTPGPAEITRCSQTYPSADQGGFIGPKPLQEGRAPVLGLIP